MSHVRKHERRGGNDGHVAMGAQIPLKEQVFSPETHTCQSFLARFKIPKEVRSKMQHESHPIFSLRSR